MTASKFKRSVNTALCLMLLSVPPTAMADKSVGGPAGPSLSDWSSVRAAYDARRHAPYPAAAGYRARNPRQHWRMSFDGRGFSVTPESARDSAARYGDGDSAAPNCNGWSWGIDLISFGRAGHERAAPPSPACIGANGRRVSYEWDDTLTEWYINDQRGLEHGYTVHKRPQVAQECDSREPESPLAPDSRESRASSASLHLTLAIRGELLPQVSQDGRDVAFVNNAGATVINYNGLTVFDADNLPLPAHFELASTGLRLVIDDADAHYPLTIDPIAQQAYLKASNTDPADLFGSVTAISGDTVVVGAYAEDSIATGVDGDQADNSASNAGAAYVFVRSAGVWSQQAYLKASNTNAGDQFGAAAAISGDTIVIGAPGEDSAAAGVNGDDSDNSAANAGAAYVFVRTGTTWSQQAYLKASNPELMDSFGWSVAISGNTVAVGSYWEDSNATGVNGDQLNNSASGSGAAYVFVRTGMTPVWSQQAYLKASNTSTNDHFGGSVAVSGNTVVVAADQEDSTSTGVNGDQANNSATDSGAAYVFVRTGMTPVWSQQAYLKASNTGSADLFGYSVAVSGNTAVVGAISEDSNATGVDGSQTDNSVETSGAAYVFIRSGTNWNQQAYLKASNTNSGDAFGAPVAAFGDTVAVGARYEDSNATGVNGNQADNSAPDSGAAYVFLREGASWSQQAYLKASNTSAGDWFGLVGVSGDTVVIGGFTEDSNATGVDGNQADNSATDSGAVYVFTGLGAPCIGFEPCDANCDGSVNPFDIGPFLELLGPSPPAPCSPCAADADGNGTINPFDISVFLDCLDV